jgi:hypothetical protein
MLTCPVTGDDFSTGIHTDKLSFESLPDPVMKALCPHCGQMHPWRTRQAKWVESVPPNISVEDLEIFSELMNRAAAVNAL